MNRAQKIALTLVITFSFGLILEIIVIVIFLLGANVTKVAFIFPVCVAGSGGIISLLFKKDKGPITHDERDKQIEKNVHLAGFGAVYLFVIFVSFFPIAIAPDARIPTTWFPGILIGAGFCQAYAQSIAILIQYGWRNHGDK
jgi:archaellum biogenesis protein FlaJ (TadC family)